MTLDYKGLTEKEVQDQIDWIIQQREFDKQMWLIHANDIIRKIIMETIK